MEDWNVRGDISERLKVLDEYDVHICTHMLHNALQFRWIMAIYTKK